MEEDSTQVVVVESLVEVEEDSRQAVVGESLVGKGKKDRIYLEREKLKEFNDVSV